MPTRLILSAAILLAFTAAPFTQTPPRYDVLIHNGRVLDGSGNPWIATDIGIRGGRIVDDCNFEHEAILSPTKRFVKTKFLVGGVWAAHSGATRRLGPARSG